MKPQNKLTLINGTMDTEGGIHTYQTANSFELVCSPTPIAVPPLPFPGDDDDWDDDDNDF